MNQSSTIIVVDRDPGAQRAIAQLLEGAGHRVTCVGTGTECLRAIESLEPDLIIVDAALPDADGAEVCRSLKAMPHLQDTLLILLLDAAEPSNRQAADPGNWADELIARPLSDGEFLARVEAILRTQRAHRALRAGEESFRTAFETERRKLTGVLDAMSDAACIVDESFGIEYANSGMIRLLGEPGDRKCHEYLRGLSSPCGDCPLKALPAADAARKQWGCTIHDRRYDVYATPMQLPGGRTAALVALKDITPQEQAQRAIARLNRLLGTLSDVNQAIVRTTDQQQLFDDICRISVERGGFLLASIALLEEDGIHIQAAASSVVVVDQPDRVAISLGDRPDRRGPTAMSIATGQHRICNDLATDPAVELWRDALLELGYRSFATFPIFLAGKAIGALRLHADTPGFFEDDEIKLLDEMAGDVSFALESLRREEIRASLQSRLLQITGAVECTGDPIGVAVDGQVIYLNAAFREQIGYTVDQLNAAGGSAAWVADAAAAEGASQAIGSGRPWQGELDIRRRDGTVFPALVRADTVKDESGQVQGVIGVLTDITERKRAEAALRDSEERYRTLFDNMLEGFAYCKIVLDDQGRPVDWVYLNVNGAFERLTGLHDIIGKRVTEAIPGIAESSPELFDIYGRVALTGWPERFEIDFTPLGLWLDVAVHSPAAGHFVAIFEDITERKHVEDRLKESEQKYRDLVETISDWVWEVDADAVYTYASSSVRSMLGYAPEEIVGKTPFDLMLPEEARRVAELLGPIAARREPINRLENAVHHADGHLVIVETTGVPVFDSSGAFRGYRGMDRDITERKRVEAALRQALSYRDRIIASSMDGFFILGPDGGIEEANQAFAEITGYSRSELLSMNIADVEVMETPEVIAQHLQQIMASGSGRFETQHRRKNGTIADIEISSVHVDTEDGPRFAVFARDVTERKRAEERQAKLTALLRAVVSMTDNLIDAPDVDTLCLRAVEMARERLGLERCSVHLLDGDELRGTFGTSYDGQTTDERQYRYPSTQWHWGLMLRHGDQQPPWHATVSPLQEWQQGAMTSRGEGWVALTPIHADHEPVGLFLNDAVRTGSELDPEQQESVAILCSLLGHMIRSKRADERLAESENRYRSLFDNAPIIMVEEDLSEAHKDLQALRRSGITDLDEYLQAHPDVVAALVSKVKVTDINLAALKLQGATSKEQLMAALPVAAAKDMCDAFRSRLVALEKERTTVDSESTITAVSGEQLSGIQRVQVVPGHESDLSRVLVSVLDITARKKAEDALRQSEAKYRSIFENTGAAMVLCDQKGVIHLCNSNFEALSGYTWQQIKGNMDWSQFVALEDQVAVHVKQAEAVQAASPAELEFRFVDRSGNTRDVLARVSLISESSEYVASLLDITDRKHAADAQRLAAVGQLAAGVAHDFNNLLAAMSLSAELADMTRRQGDYEKVTDIVLRSSQRGADLCRNLMAFARPQEPRREPVYVEAVVEAALAVVARQMETVGVTVRRQYEPDNQRIMADAGQLEQVFLNLFINACHAMPDGGQLSVETRYVRDRQDDPGIAVVTVRDTGTGIASEHLPRIFEPFFTTKGRLGESETPGTGLGLSVSHGIVEAHEGTLRVSSEVGVGTTFEISFPVRISEVDGPIGSGVETVVSPEASPSGSAHILLADDETDIRDVMRAALVQAGLTVTTAPNAADAIAAIRGQRFDVVITDLLMPGGGGRAVLEAIKTLESPPPVIVMTGRLETHIADELIAAGADECVQKPATRETILGAVTRALDKKERNAEG
jgi:PAS domain S-box-containing protein